jgi:hypothetical protein
LGTAVTALGVLVSTPEGKVLTPFAGYVLTAAAILGVGLTVYGLSQTINLSSDEFKLTVIDGHPYAKFVTSNPFNPVIFGTVPPQLQPVNPQNWTPINVDNLPPNPGGGTGNEGTGNEGTGNEGTGNEGTGSEGTGSEGTGSEGTTGDEGPGTGSEGTGSEGPIDTGKESSDPEDISNFISTSPITGNVWERHAI